jgi:hypothetical protein
MRLNRTRAVVHGSTGRTFLAGLKGGLQSAAISAAVLLGGAAPFLLAGCGHPSAAAASDSDEDSAPVKALVAVSTTKAVR